MDAFLDILLFGVVQFFVLLGLFGLMVPGFPGTVVMWVAVLVYGLIAGFGTPGIVLFIIISLLMLGSVIVDNVLMMSGARQGGVPWTVILLAVVVGTIGTLVFPPIGGLIAVPIAILLLEYNRTRDWAAARQATIALVKGWGLGFLARFGMGFLFLALCCLCVWF